MGGVGQGKGRGWQSGMDTFTGEPCVETLLRPEVFAVRMSLMESVLSELTTPRRVTASGRESFPSRLGLNATTVCMQGASRLWKALLQVLSFDCGWEEQGEGSQSDGW